MLQPALPGWKAECVGDDIAWMKFGLDGRLYAINPESGFFGVAPGTSMQSNPNALRALARNSIFTNCAGTADGDVWWEGMTDPPPAGIESWTRKPWTPGCGEKAAHPNARYTVPAAQCPVIDPAWEDPRGVPISAILFGGRRDSVVPLVYEARNWRHGTFLGAIQASETTAAQAGAVGQLRHDPMAMLPFCGYHMGDYFAHWLKIGAAAPDRMPRVFFVNWFRKSPEGQWLWPGFGDNIRVLRWICERVAGTGRAKETPIGWLPPDDALDLSGITLPRENLRELLRVDVAAWKKETDEIESFFRTFGDRLPDGLREELGELRCRLAAAPE
jgi:phosphoenolpyruvate carboxykinase (GTP)